LCNNDKINTFYKVDLMRFRVGNIVEVQITIAAVPVKNNKHKMIIQLRSLALLDGSFTDVSIQNSRHREYNALTTEGNPASYH
jgi:hypothetical protein